VVAVIRIRTEREHCCDDIAVEVCGDPVGYAEALTTLASWARRAPPMRPGHAASSFAVAATGGTLLHRVRALLHAAGDATPAAESAVRDRGNVLLDRHSSARGCCVVAQAPPPLDDPAFDRRLGPAEINASSATTCSRAGALRARRSARARAPGMSRSRIPAARLSFMGFTGRQPDPLCL
jgi:hypothetical protein